MTKKTGRSADNDPGLASLINAIHLQFVLLENLGIFMSKLL